MQPTEAGDKLHTYAQRILQLLTEAERELMALGEHQSLSGGATPV
ncbi:MAG: LysR family transcriptional regulator [Chloroflexi bacterium]|nr:LysR family transcriptional regulator [Chloroflexota bacterium]